MTALKPLNSALRSQLAGISEDDKLHFDNVPMEASIDVDNAFIDYRSRHDREHPAKPYLHIQGHVNSLNGQMPYGAKEFDFKDDHKPRIDMYYEFNNDQLSNLVSKGLYDRGFAIPEALLDAEMDIPVSCNFVVVKPDPKAENLPVYIGEINNRYNINLDLDNSEYDLADVFEKVKAEDYQDEDQQEEQMQNGMQIDGHTLDEQNYISGDETEAKPASLGVAHDHDTSENKEQTQDGEEYANPEEYENGDYIAPSEEQDMGQAQETTPEEDGNNGQEEEQENSIDPETASLLNKAQARLDKHRQIVKQAVAARKRQEELAKQAAEQNEDNLDEEDGNNLIGPSEDEGEDKDNENSAVKDDTSAERLSQLRAAEEARDQNMIENTNFNDSSDLSDDGDDGNDETDEDQDDDLSAEVKAKKRRARNRRNRKNRKHKNVSTKVSHREIILNQVEAPEEPKPGKNDQLSL